MTLPSRAAPVADSQQQGVISSAGIRGTAEVPYPVEFTARAGEYFRIWIVNLALTILTLGIYSAWAKVRKRRYFYSHTRVAGEGFEYRARPIAILKGRLVAVALMVLFYGVGYVAPLWQLVLLVPLAIAGPWLLVRSLAFNAYNSAYRNIRFTFGGTYKECMKLVLLYGMLVVATVGLAFPFLKRRMVQFIAAGHGFGSAPFSVADAFKKPFIRAYAVAYGFALLGGVLFFAMIAGAGLVSRGQEGGSAAAAIFPLAMLFLYGGMFFLFAYVRARTANALWGHLEVGPVRFESRLRARDLAWLYLSNLVVLLLTVGLAAPWAAVRTMRYRASKTTLIASGPLETFLQAETGRVSVTGEEVAEMFDIDIAL
jgi:uncharacterized membrane protein YjgN (DUF898 family)